MSVFPSLFNRQFNIFDPFQGLIFSSDDNSETQMDWKETPKSHVFEFDLPGLTKDDVKLEVHQGRVLYISGERKEKEEETDDKRSGDKWHCLERSRGRFMRQFRLPENAKADEIKAVMENGVLTVTVPKDEVKKKVKNTVVEISGDDEQRQNSKGLGRFVCFKA